MKLGARNSRFVAFVLAVLSVLALASLNMFGQDISGNVVGTVIDASGAAVVGAEVEATNTGTNVVTRTKSNGTGQYRIDNLLPGNYRISVKAQGFKSFAETVDVQLNKTGTLNVTLTPGAATETVEVSGAPPIIDTTTAQLQSTYETLQVADVPTASVGLGVINLSLLQAGVGSSGGLGAGTGPAVGGQRPRDNNYTVDGVDNNDKGVTGPIIYVPNDAVENFTVIQNQFSPEFGHSAGGQFNTIVKSGTNAYHGVAYEYFQNRNLNAIDNLVVLSTAPGTSPTNTRFDNNRFGGAVGGPILKNKLFFFVNYEYNPIGQTAIPAAIQAPTAAGYTSALALPGISTANLQAFQKWAQAPTSSGSAVNICSAAPNPDATCPGGATTAIDTGNLLVQAPNWNNTAALVVSGDWNISDKDQVRVRDIYNKNTFVDTAATLPAFYQSFRFPYHLANVAEFHSFGANLSNEVRVGFHRSAQSWTVGNQTFLPTLDAFPNLTIDDLGGINVGPDPNAPQYANQNLYQALDNVSWIKGNHTLKFGFEGRKHISPQKFIQRSRGDYDWPQFGDFAWDLAPSQDGGFAERSFGNTGYSGDQYALYTFVNDIWKIRPNLSLNMGLRYEYTSTPYGWTQQTLNSVADVPGLITFGSPQAPKKDFMPRLGFAYSPGTSGTMSIRGGFGMAYDVLYDNIGVLERPPEIGSTVDCPNPSCTTGGAGGGSGFLANGGIPPLGLSGITQLTAAQARLTTSAYLPNKVKYPYAEAWNLGVSKVFRSNYTAEVRYVGSRGVDLNVQNRIDIIPTVNSSNNLPFFLNCDSTCTGLSGTNTSRNLTTLLDLEGNQLAFINPSYLNAGFGTVNPTADCPTGGCFSEITSYQPWGASTYHGLQGQLDRRFTNGLYLQAAYTFSKTIDNSTADFFSTIIAPRRPQDFSNLSAERSNSILDHRNRFSLSLVYDTQWFKHSSSWLARNLLSGYEVAPVYIYETGQWGTVQAGRDVNLNTDSAPDRVFVNPAGIKGTGSDVTAVTDPAGDVVGYVANNPNAYFIRAGTGTLPNAGRSDLQSPAINNMDFTVAKTIKFNERMSFKFQLQALNFFNHPQYTTGSVNQANGISDTGGAQRNVLIPSSANLQPQQIGLINFQNGVFNQWRSAFGSNARVVQLGAKFMF